VRAGEREKMTHSLSSNLEGNVLFWGEGWGLGEEKGKNVPRDKIYASERINVDGKEKNV